MGRLKRGRERRGKVVVVVAVGVVAHSAVCVLPPCVQGQKKKWEWAGTEGSREKDRKEGRLKTLPLCRQILDDSSDIKVFSLTEELMWVCE